MYLSKKISKTMASILMAGLSVSAWAVTPGSGTWVKETTLFGLQNAHVYVPKNPSPATIGTGRALMISLHGCGMTATNVINRGFNWEDTAEKYGMVVVAPTVPTTSRAVSGCWDWFGANHSRATRDEAVILKLVDALKSRASLEIDPKQIYVTGLSSGAGLVIDLACVAPDYFAGVGVNAGPELDETSTTLGTKAHYAPADVAAKCKTYAGSYVGSLTGKQIASVVNGTKDTFVDPSHDKVDVDMFKLIYNASYSNGPFTDVKSTGESWKDGNGNTRVSWVQATDMAHAWPAGAGGSGGGYYVDYTHINYPAYVTKFFFDNNLVVSRNPRPVMTSCGFSVSSPTATSATISGAATDDGSISSYKVVLSGTTAINDTAAGSGSGFSKSYSLANGYYSGTVTAYDNLGQAAEQPCAIAQFLVGTAPVIPAPTGLIVTAVSTNTISLSWDAVNGATGYNVYRNNAKVNAAPVTGTTFTDTGLTANTPYSYTVRAIIGGESADSIKLNTATSAQPVYSEVQTGSATTHYVAKRLSVSGYLAMGAKYGYINSFKLYKCDAVWTNSPTCGPLQ